MEHNKSGLVGLTINTFNANDIARCRVSFSAAQKTVVHGLAKTPCVTMAAGDGRLSVSGVKMCFAYQLIALDKFGAEAMSSIPASKKRDDLVLSHLCGTRNCVVATHLEIVQKWINDERTSCHFVMQSIKNKAIEDGNDWCASLQELSPRLCRHAHSTGVCCGSW